MMCLLLMLLGSTVQAVHAHGALLPGGAAHVSADSSSGHFAPEDLCPLCAAMHGITAGLTYLPAAVVKVSAVVPTADATLPRTRDWIFDLFGRPPPSTL